MRVNEKTKNLLEGLSEEEIRKYAEQYVPEDIKANTSYFTSQTARRCNMFGALSAIRKAAYECVLENDKSLNDFSQFEFESFDNKIINVYNGTNHNISMYSLDNENFSSKRGKLGYALINPQKRPDVIYEQKNPLTVIKKESKPIRIGDINYLCSDRFLPVSPFDGYEKYDVIVVSSLYAEAVKNTAMKHQGKNILDFLDRLYVLTEHISSVESPYDGSKIIKFVGNGALQKVVSIKVPANYNQEIQDGKHPSLVSMMHCLEWYKNHFSELDHVVKIYAKQLCKNIKLEIKRRESDFVYATEKVF